MTIDRRASTSSCFAYSFSVSIATVAVPLLGIEAGYSAAEIGVYVGISGLSQLLARMCLMSAMRRWPDRHLTSVASMALLGSCLLLFASSAPVSYIGAQVLMGISRAWFWAGMQAHVVRINEKAIEALAGVNLASSLGMVTGPLAAGALTEVSMGWAFLGAAGSALVSLIFLLATRKLPILAKDRGGGRLLLGTGVMIGCWASVSAGAWRAMMGSYIPVLLDGARLSPLTIGILLSAANVGVLVGSGMLPRRLDGARWVFVAAATLVTGLGLALAAYVASLAFAAGVALVGSGLGAGVLQTLGPGVATNSVAAADRAQAVVTTGTYRAAALLGAPMIASGLLASTALSVAGAVAAMGAIIMVPALGIGAMVKFVEGRSRR